MTKIGSSTSVSRRAFRAALVAVAAAVAGPALAQSGGASEPSSAAQPRLPVATLDQDALFLQSAFGQRVQSDLERARDALAAENRRIESDLVEEERALTERRGAVPAAEFQSLASAFDDKVQRIRQEREAKARQLQQRLEAERQRFFEAIGPILTDLLRTRGAAVLLDSDAVLFAVQGVDITDAAIEAIDARLGSGDDDGFALPSGDGGSQP